MTDQDLLSELQLALLEPADGGASFPSEVWTRDEVLDALNAAIRELVRASQILATRTELNLLAGTSTVTLPADWMATFLMAWQASGIRSPLLPTDRFEADTALLAWELLPSRPIAYADLDSTTLTVRLVPGTSSDGTLEIVYAARPTAITGSGTILPLPDELASGEKYGALQSLLSKVGRMQDPERAAYCADRVTLVETAADLLLSGWA